MSLDELEAYIKEYKHLPNVPSAAEMSEGVRPTDFSMRLLEKIEELTLYILQQQALIEELQTRVEALEGN